MFFPVARGDFPLSAPLRPLRGKLGFRGWEAREGPNRRSRAGYLHGMVIGGYETQREFFGGTQARPGTSAVCLVVCACFLYDFI